jgi:dTDP-4-amino-4,6-dideoxygalactose transaminase
MERFIQVSVPITGEEEAAAAREVILSGNFVSGARVREFENRFAAYVGSGHACAASNCPAALHMALAVLGVRPGDEVVVPPLTFMSTITAVIHQGATPVFADIDPDNFCLDPAQVEKVAGPRTKAVIPVHYLGNACDMDGIMNVARRKNLFVIEDCAQAHGTEFRGRKVGSIGHIGCFSFYATKHMTTGEGGMLTSDNADWMDLSRKIRSHGLINRDDHEYLGYNYRMTEMEAAIGLVQLAKLEAFNEQRIKNCEYILTAWPSTGPPIPGLVQPAGHRPARAAHLLLVPDHHQHRAGRRPCGGGGPAARAGRGGPPALQGAALPPEGAGARRRQPAQPIHRTTGACPCLYASASPAGSSPANHPRLTREGDGFRCRNRGQPVLIKA